MSKIVEESLSELVADLTLKNRELKAQLDQTQKWGEAGWHRWMLLQNAYLSSLKVEQAR